MRYEQFQEAMLDKVKKELRDEVRITIIQKDSYNNRVEEGMMFQREGENESPIFCLEIRENKLFEMEITDHRRMYPVDFFHMDSVISKMIREEMPEGMGISMYVLSGEKKSYGRAAMLYNDILGDIADFLGESYYISPNGIHELIIVPESQSSKSGELNEIICRAKTTDLKPEEVLCAHAYLYDKSKKRMIY